MSEFHKHRFGGGRPLDAQAGRGGRERDPVRAHPTGILTSPTRDSYTTSVNPLYARTIRSTVFGTLILAALLFVPAWTLKYWQGWAFLAAFTIPSALIGVYLAIYDPKLLERRMRAGPRAEKEPRQKIIVFFVMLGFITLLVFPALDHRFGWSPVSARVSLLGDLLIVLGFVLFFFALRVNSYGASTIQVVEGQRVISTGPYAIVRHPMYAGVLPLLVGIPLSLGSWWGLLLIIPFIGILVWRLLEEERFLHKNLPGYTAYTSRVRYRLVPYIW
jgi:protein-S-isoprenylcysteine O-methyltransferase Ste14